MKKWIFGFLTMIVVFTICGFLFYTIFGKFSNLFQLISAVIAFIAGTPVYRYFLTKEVESK
jgi:hypothetical protein